MTVKKTFAYTGLCLKALLLAFIFQVIFVIGRNFEFFRYNTDFFVGTETIKNNFSVLGAIITAIVLLLIFIALYKKKKVIYDFIYRFRYPIAGVILILCVVFRLSGSSIGCWNQCLGLENSSFENVIWGMSQQIRCDEWATNTPMAFSQQFTDYSYFSDIIRGSTTDSFIVYGQPVWDLAVIFRPFHWGYLLLGSEMGLSFFWCARLIALFMVSFEFSMRFFKKSKPLCVFYAVMVTFAPVVQWWFAINGFVEMLIWGQLLVLMIDFYLKSYSYKLRILYAFVVFISAGGFILTFYPAWEIPLFYVFFALAIAVIIKNRKNTNLKLLKDGAIILSTIILLGVSMYLIFVKSHDTIQQVLNSEYPGQRILMGGDEANRFFVYNCNLFFPFDGNLAPNVCEQSVFLDLFPLGIIVAVFAMIKNRKADSILLALIAVNLLMFAYCVIGFSPLLAQITMFSHCASGRMVVVITFVNMLMLFRGSSMLLRKQLKVLPIVIFCVIFTAFSVYMTCYEFTEYMTLEKIILSAVFVLLCCLIFLLFNCSFVRKFALPFVSVAIIIIASFVNPVRVGAGVIYNSQWYQAVSAVQQQDKDAKWMTEGMGYPLLNFPIMAGASTINSTNIYPNIELWQKLDPENKYTSIYNRYAHVSIELIPEDEETYFQIGYSVDCFTVYLSISDLSKLDIDYIISPHYLEYHSNSSHKIEEITTIDNDPTLKIFKVEYDV